MWHPSDTDRAPALDVFPRNEKKPDRRSGLALGLGGVFGTPGDDGLQGQIVLIGGLAEVGVEAVVADGQRVVGCAGLLVLLLPDAAALDQLAARGAAEDAVRGGHRVRARDGFDRDVEVEGQGRRSGSRWSLCPWRFRCRHW